MNRPAQRTRDDCGVYQCPRCGAGLVPDESGLRCDEGHRYEVAEGVPQLFAQGPPQLPDEHVRRAVDLARREGWRAALEAVFASDPALQYVTDPSRALFVDLLDLDESCLVLEIGASLGQITEKLAARAGHVFALELDPPQAAFTRLRCEEQGLTNVSVASGGDDCGLPYGDGRFDVVVCNLVLEWCGAGQTRTRFADGRRCQERLLAESARVLRRGGRLFVATKNRWDPQLLRGGRDEHVDDLRFGNALPRPLLAAWLRLSGRKPPPGLLYSYRELHRSLARLGFDPVRGYWAVPHPRWPREYVPAEAQALRQARRRGVQRLGSSRAQRALASVAPARWIPWIAPGLVFLARKR
jgi:SAM-dependent methyltransferase